ncbi:polyhydroxybutyrate depolymerase [Pelomyxa schiedti]|nr:polyhydroxybutyrate depolymerase [Pelomyxa schiedti]
MFAAIIRSEVPLFPYSIDPSQISSSGFADGGYMTGQLLVIYSSVFMGAGIVDSGPYYCAQGSLTYAEMQCSYLGSDIVLSTLWTDTSTFDTNELIDDVANMVDDRLYFFHGTLDHVTEEAVVEKATEYWSKYLVSDSNILYVNTVAAAHAWVTLDWGSKCAYFGTPYINNCNYDMAGEMYNWIYGTLNPRGSMITSNFVSFSQAAYIEDGSPKSISLGETGYMYVPSGCQDGITPCRLTFVFHGCAQTISDINDEFYMHSGVNEWAETNNIIVVYPQAARSISSPANPNGCWDWWGYTNSVTKDLYATNEGPQIMFIRNILKGFGI